MKEKFTQGPWEIKYSKFGDIDSASVYNKHGFLASANVIKIDETRLDGESWLAMRKRTHSARKAAEIESIANIQLIASAPDLYTELAKARSIIQILINDGYTGYIGQRETIDLALAKARGEESGE